jgi:hypothetical protein
MSSNSSGFSIKAARVPITPERAPEEGDFDDILKAILQLDDISTAHIVFSCQMGTGRSTLGMLVACLLCKYLSRKPEYGQSLRISPSTFFLNLSPSTPSPSLPVTASLEDEVDLSLSLCRVLENGHDVKAEVDRMIEILSAGNKSNMRTAILENIEKVCQI